MSNATAVAPERATKAPTRGKAAATPAPAAQKQARPPLSEDDYRAIAIGSQICSLLMPIIEGPFGVDRVIGFHHISDAESHAWDLHKIEEEWTEDGPPPTVHDLVLLIHSHLHLAMAEIGASQDTSNAPTMYCVRLLVGEAFQLARDLQEAYLGLPATSASLAAMTNKLQQPGTAAAVIEAGACQFRDRPTPPIRRVEDPSQSQAGYRHSPRDIRAVFETLATQCEAVRDFSIDIRSRLQSESGSVVEACNDLTIVQHMVAFMGSMCEEMRGGAGTLIGGPAAWATMDGIEAIGDAA